MLNKKKNTLAKLLAEEDVFVVHKQMDTAYFDVKARELGLPIWKDTEVSEEETDLMILHEIGHALWTPLDMMEKMQIRKIEKSVVNVIEDARIEKFVKNKYAGSLGIFNRAYSSLAKKDFFGTKGKDLTKYNLIDRINLFFKAASNLSIDFSAEEMGWVNKVANTTTADEVLDLSEELIEWMKDHPESMGEEDNSDNSDMGQSCDGGEEGDGSGTAGPPSNAGDPGDDSGPSSDGDSEDDDSDGDSDGSSGKSDDDEKSDGKDGKGKSEEVDSDDSDGGEDSTDGTEGGKGSTGEGDTPKAKTDDAFGKSLKNARDKNAETVCYAKIPDLDLNKVIVPYKKVLADLNAHYSGEASGHASVDTSTDLYIKSCKKEVDKLKADSKKTVAYMVKEFEMKKSADQYARAAVSKTGTLDMNKLHTYKYNEDLFKKVTTLPGATDHGMVLVLDWSGSMGGNLKATVSQLFNLVWFCRRTQIPFEVYAFTDGFIPRSDRSDEDTKVHFEHGALVVGRINLLNFFSSKMTNEEEMKMNHNVMILSSYCRYRSYATQGYQIPAAEGYRLGGTPLNEAIIALMKVLPKFKKETGVQKVNTIFLTDGAGCPMQEKWDYRMNDGRYEDDKTPCREVFMNRIALPLTLTDPVTHKTVTIEDGGTRRGEYRFYSHDLTPTLLEMLKNRVNGMNVVGFFIAGSGRKGNVDRQTIEGLIGWGDEDKIKKAIKTIKKDRVLVITQNGFDEYYILPGGAQLNPENETLSDDLIGAGKGKLKSAFAKASVGKIASRQLLNKFVAMVA